MTTHLNEDLQRTIAEYKKDNQRAGLDKICKKFKVSKRQVQYSIKKYAEEFGITLKENTNEALQKKIAVWKSNHPEATHEQLAERFNVDVHKVKYALEKFAERAELLNNTRKGIRIKSRIIAGSITDTEILKTQLNLCLAELENNQEMNINSRMDLVAKAMRVKSQLQAIEIESHIKRFDAALIKAIIKRFNPAVTDDDVIRIYNEEYTTWQNAQ